MTHTKHQGFTLIELLVVISIIAILAGMLLPAISLVRESARKANCGSNQRQIMLAMIAYTSENDGMWPYCSDGATGPTYNDIAIPTTGQAKQSIASLEFVSSWSDGELVRKLFACPSNSAIKPDAEAATGMVTTSSASTSTGGWVLEKVGYAFDPSVAPTAKATRVVLGDRPANGTETNHKKVAIACYADGHVGNANRITGTASGTNKCKAIDGSDVGGIFPNADANGNGGPDNIYDDNLETGMDKRGNGSPTRAFLR